MIVCAWLSHVHNIFNMSTLSQAARANCGPDAAKCSAPPAAMKGHSEMQAGSALVFQTTRNLSLETLVLNPSAPEFLTALISE